MIYGKDFASVYSDRWAFWGPKMWEFLSPIIRKELPHAKRWLDLCCGTGSLLRLASNDGFITTGVDISRHQINHARKNVPKARFVVGDVRELSLKREFDVVTCMEMLEHVPEPGSVIAACAKLVKPDGAVFFSTINRNPKSYLLAIVGAEYILNMLPRGTHDYSKFIRPSEMEGWIRHGGLELKELTGMSYNPLARSYSLGRDLDVNYLAYCMKSEEME